MLAPLRDHFCPKDPRSSPLLSTAKGHYFNRLSVEVTPDVPGFEEAQWIVSEDVNVEHLLDVFTSIDAEPDDVWNACIHFMDHLYWHKKRLVVLGPKIEGLRDDHPSKPQCLSKLARLFDFVGNFMEEKRLLALALKFRREQGDDRGVAGTLRLLSDANRQLYLFEEGIQQAEEALEIYERLSDPVAQTECLNTLAYLLYGDGQLDAAEKVASRAIDLLPEEDNQFLVCQCHYVLGDIHRSKGKKEKAVHHYETALGIASSSNWHAELFWINYSLAQLFPDEGRFDDAYLYIERAKSYAANNAYYLGRAMELQAGFLYRQRRLEEARSEVLRAANLYEKAGAAKDVEDCRELLQWIEEGGFLPMVLLFIRINFPFKLWGPGNGVGGSVGSFKSSRCPFTASTAMPSTVSTTPSLFIPPPLLAHTILYSLSYYLSLIYILSCLFPRPRTMLVFHLCIPYIAHSVQHFGSAMPYFPSCSP